MHETLTTHKIKKTPQQIPLEVIKGETPLKNTPKEDAVSLEDFDDLRVTKEKAIPQPEPTITIGGSGIAAPGNVSGISAAAKAGKTAVMALMLGGAISKTGHLDGFIDLEVIPNYSGKAVVHFDTEQSEADQQSLVNTILKRNSFDETPDYFRSYNIRQLTLDTYQQITDQICEACNKVFDGVHLIVIDGGADYIASVNDESAATLIVQYFIHLSIRYNCPVVVVVHQNPGSDKERGHFGSELQRKCYGLLTVTKEGDISTLQPKIMRKAGNGDIPLIHFQFSKEKGYHVQIDAQDKEDLKNEKNRAKIKIIADQVFAPPSAFKTNEAIRKIAQHTKQSESTAKRNLKDMDAWGFIDKSEDGFYRINMTGVKRGQTGSDEPD